MNESNINPKLEEILDFAEDEGSIRIGDVVIAPPPLPACTFNATEPRLIITHIENIDFKSYAGLRTLGPFHKNFTAIVGANGSGKSNVIDAMLFVFGYRAQKIRSKKISVLIHNSDEHPDIQSCTVKVYFHKIKDTGENTCDIIPDSAFCISRTAFRDNSSYYEIDGLRVQLKKVGALLRSYGIDLDHNRFLILQGEIEMIAMMKPKGNEQDFGMLEYLEEIIGSNRFIEPIEHFSKKIEELNNIQIEKLNRMKLVEKEKDDLKVMKTEAVEYMKLENEIVSSQNILYQALRQNKENEVELAKRNRDSTKEELGKLKTQEEQISSKREVKENRYAEMQVQYEKLKVAVEEAVERFGELERMDVVCRANIDMAKAKLKKLAKLLEDEETKLVELKKVETTRKGEVLELEKKKQKLQTKKENEEKKLKGVMVSIREETNVLHEGKGKMEVKLIDLKKTVFEAKATMDLAQLQLDMLVSGEKKAQAKLEEFERKLREVTATIIELKKKLSGAELRVSATEKELEDLKNQHQEVVIEETSHFEEVRSKQAELDEASAALRVSSKSHSCNVISKFLMEQQQLGNISGILGRLGDLGEIEEKYDVAISTICGPLDNIVTDTMATAQKCVEYLKKHEKGYCTFIALDKMLNWKCVNQANIAESPYPEKVPRLFDLVKVKDVRVLPAFYFALRDTLVANDLDQATRIGMYGAKRYKVVTLKGELIDVTGTMSGGGRVSSGRMGKSSTCVDVTPQDVEKLRKSLEDAKKKAKELKGKRISLGMKMNSTEKHVNTFKHQLSQYRIEYSSHKTREDFITKQIPEQKSKVFAAAPDKKKLNETMTELDIAKESYDKANEVADEVAIKVEQLQKEIVSVTETRYGAVQKILDKLSKEIGAVGHNINTSAIAVKMACRNQVKTENKIKSLTEDQNETKENLEQLMKEYKELTSKATKIVETKTSLENELKNLSDQKKNIKKEINKESSEELEIKKKIIDVKNDLKVLESELNEKQDAFRRIQTNLGKLRLQKIEEDCDDPLTLPILTPQELADVSVNAISCEIGAIETQMGKMKPNMSSIAEYKIKEQLYKSRMKDLEQVTKEKEKMKKHFSELRKQRLNEFMKGFRTITFKLKEVYQMLTLGGDAELELKDSLDPFAEGIVFSVRPPMKSWKNITKLSGGEKTLSSLALVLALHYYRPTPFYVMDEIDAALDIRNVSIVGHYIKESTRNAQFIVISLRPNMFQIADSLIGIYKPSGCTNSIAVSPETVMLQAKDELSVLDSSSAEDTEEKSSPGLIAAKSVCENLADTVGHSSSSNNDSKNLNVSQVAESFASCSKDQQTED